MIKVVIAEDQRILRESLKIIIDSDKELSVVGCAENGLEAFELCQKLKPNLVLMDIFMPLCDGVQGTKMIKERYKDINVLIITTFEDERSIVNALKNGADGYILKDIAPDDLIEVIKNINKGFGVVNKKTFSMLTKQLDGTNSENSYIEKRKNPNRSFHMDSESDMDITLTEREMSIIRQIAEGKNNREIAESLFLAEGRVKNIITGILSKLNLRYRTQLVVFAIKNNLV